MFLKEIHAGVVDVYEEDYESGAKRLKEVLVSAVRTPTDQCRLTRDTLWIGNSQKKGACHFLINYGYFKGWITDNAEIFNSIFENELRFILLISVFNEPQNDAADFLSVYSKTFSLSDSNLNGENQYEFSEFVSRRSLVHKVLKEMALNGLVKPIPSKAGIVYQITAAGKNLSDSLCSDYAIQYRETARKVVSAVIGKFEIKIISHINAVSAKSLKESL